MLPAPAALLILACIDRAESTLGKYQPSQVDAGLLDMSGTLTGSRARVSRVSCSLQDLTFRAHRGVGLVPNNWGLRKISHSHPPYFPVILSLLSFGKGPFSQWAHLSWVDVRYWKYLRKTSEGEQLRKSQSQSLPVLNLAWDSLPTVTEPLTCF